MAGDGDCGATLTLADGRVVNRLPELHSRPYQSIFGDFAAPRVVYGTREGQRIEAAPLDARLGLPEDRCSYVLRDWNQALVVENPYGQVDAVLSALLLYAFGAMGPVFFLLGFLPFTIVESVIRPFAMDVLLNIVKKDAGTASALINFVPTLLGSLGMMAGTLPWPNFILGLSVLLALATAGAIAIYGFVRQI